MTMTNRRNGLIAAGSFAALASISAVIPSYGQQPLPGQPGFGELLVKAAKESPGCLGVETGRTNSGALVIFAWFANKKAIVDWYRSEFHQRAMKAAFPNLAVDREPLPDIPDDSGFILALVTLRLSNAPPTDAAPLPIQSIGIELYTPLPNGVAVGGRFAPSAVKVPGLREIDLATVTRETR